MTHFYNILRRVSLSLLLLLTISPLLSPVWGRQYCGGSTDKTSSAGSDIFWRCELLGSNNYRLEVTTTGASFTGINYIQIVVNNGDWQSFNNGNAGLSYYDENKTLRLDFSSTTEPQLKVVDAYFTDNEYSSRQLPIPGDITWGECVSTTTIYFVAPKSWPDEVPKVYLWGASGNNTWPGKAMTLDMTNCMGDKVYYYTFATSTGYDKCIFSYGDNSDSKKTGNLDIDPGKCYYRYDWVTYSDATTAQTVYYVNTNRWAQPYAHFWIDAHSHKSFPGVAMTESPQLDNCGHHIWSAQCVPLFANCLFSDGTSTNKTGDLSVNPSHYYSVDDWYGDIASCPKTCGTLYYVNTNNWETPHIYLRRTSDPAFGNGHRGTAMTNTGVTDDCGNAVWKYDVDLGIYADCVFSNGTNDHGKSGAQAVDANVGKYFHTRGWFSDINSYNCRTVYFVNTKDWAQPYIYTWKSYDSYVNAPQPGLKMVNTGLTDECNHTVWKYTYADGVYDWCYINDGTTPRGVGDQWTADMQPQPGKYFTQQDNQWHNTLEDCPVDCNVLYFVNDAEWTDVYAFLWTENVASNHDWPGVKMVKVGQDDCHHDVYRISYGSSYANVIFSGMKNSTRKQTADLTTADHDRQYYYTVNGWQPVASDLACFDSENNLALNKPAFASHKEAEKALANDGSLGSRWSSDGNKDSWWTVDLAGYYNINLIKIKWETACPKEYVIEASFDNINWVTIEHKYSVPTVDVLLDYPVSTPARYLRLRSLADNTGYGMSFWELEAYGTSIFPYTNDLPEWAYLAPSKVDLTSFDLCVSILDKTTLPDNITYHYTINGGASVSATATNGVIPFSGLTPDTDYTIDIYGCDEADNCTVHKEIVVHTKAFDQNENLAYNKPASASYTNAGRQPSYANDQIFTHTWESTNSSAANKDWWQVNLQGDYQVRLVKIWWDLPHPVEYVLESSLDGTHWATIRYEDTEATWSRDCDLGKVMSYKVDAPAHYLRVRSLHDKDGYRIGMWEFEAYGSALFNPGLGPEWTYLQATQVGPSSFALMVGAVDGDNVTAPENLDYYYTINGNAPVATKAADGKIRFSGLMPSTTYTLRLYVQDEAGNRSVTKTIVVKTPAFDVNANLALNKPSFASHEGDGSGTWRAEEANDGSYGTRWAPGNVHNRAWWYVDLGDNYNLSEIRVAFDGLRPTNYRVDIADNITDPSDDSQWTAIAVKNTQPTATPEHNNSVYNSYSATGTHGRYVRFRSEDDGDFHIWEVEVYGTSFHDYRDMSYCEGASIERNASDLSAFVAGYTYHFTTENTNQVNVEFKLLDQKEGLVAHLWLLAPGFKEITNIPSTGPQTFATSFSDYPAGQEIQIACKFAYAGGMTATKYFPYVVGTTCSEPEVNMFLHLLTKDGTPISSHYQFHESKVADVFALTCQLQAGTYTYYLSDNEDRSAAGAQRSQKTHTLVVPVQQKVNFYAATLDRFASSLDEISISGELLDATSHPGGRQTLIWTNDRTQAQKIITFNALHTIDSHNAYRVEKLDNAGQLTPDYSSVVDPAARNMVMGWSAGTVTFDLPSLSCSWHEYNPGICSQEGGPGDGLGGVGFMTFEDGYNVEISMDYEGGTPNLVLDVTSYDKDLPTGNALFFAFTNNDLGSIREWYLTKDPANDHHYTGRITSTTPDKAGNSIGSAWNWSGGTYRFAVKIEQNDKVYVTKDFYYTLGVSEGCAPRTFEIYHHDDAPLDGRTQFEGGQVVQPICYHRKFKPGAWETLIVPFEVSRVTVYDDDLGAEVDLVPQHNREYADYLLRYFGDNTSVVENDFKDNWKNLPADKNLPEANVPYIIMLPWDETEWYASRYLNFYGDSYQVINSTFTPTAAPAVDEFSYHGNTTMMPQRLHNAFILDNKGEYFVNQPDVNPLYPFECYVLSSLTEKASAPIRRFSTFAHDSDVTTGRPEIHTGDLLYYYDGSQLHIESPIATPLYIYGIDGRLVTTLSVTDAGEVAVTLPRGIYIVSSSFDVLKLAL